MASRLGSISSSILTGIIRSRQDAIVEVDEEIVDFSRDLPNTDFSIAIEVPPTSGSYTHEMIAAALSSPPTDLSGCFIRFVMFVYATGGKITYKRLPNDSYETTVTWPSASRGGLIDAVQEVRPDHDPYAPREQREM